MQMCGGLGVSDDLPLARLSREVRPFRIYDGPSEVHRWSIAKRAARAAQGRAGEAADGGRSARTSCTGSGRSSSTAASTVVG